MKGGRFSSKQRRIIQIIRDVLETCKTERLKTEIFRFANLNFKDMSQHVDSLIRSDLLTNHKRKITRMGKLHSFYKTTKKGVDIILRVNELERLLGW